MSVVVICSAVAACSSAGHYTGSPSVLVTQSSAGQTLSEPPGCEIFGARPTDQAALQPRPSAVTATWKAGAVTPCVVTTSGAPLAERLRDDLLASPEVPKDASIACPADLFRRVALTFDGSRRPQTAVIALDGCGNVLLPGHQHQAFTATEQTLRDLEAIAPPSFIDIIKGRLPR